MLKRHYDKERIDARLDYAVMISIIKMLEGVTRMLKTELDRAITQDKEEENAD